MVLGSLRPLLGAVFGIALYAALASGLLDLFKVPSDDLTKQLYFYIVVAFLAALRAWSCLAARSGRRNRN